MKPKTIAALILIFLILPFGMSYGQLKSQLKETPTVEQRIKVPGIGSSLMGLGFLDPNRFSMRQSYSLTFSTFGNQSASMGIYQNNMSYIFSDKLMMNARLGMIHDPLKMGNTQMNQNFLNNLFYGADVIYHPKENLLLNLSFEKVPSLYRYGYNSPYSSPYSYFPY